METQVDLEEARRLQDEWLAAQPKWPQHKENPLIVRANEAWLSLPEDAKLRSMERNLRLTCTQRFEQLKMRLNLLSEHGEECRSNEDFVRLLYPDL